VKRRDCAPSTCEICLYLSEWFADIMKEETHDAKDRKVSGV
jgi:hypothetical protein